MMKTSKERTVSKHGKTSEFGETVRSSNVFKRKSVPSEEEIRKKAYEIYNQRIDRGNHGTALDDWHKAEELLKDS